MSIPIKFYGIQLKPVIRRKFIAQNTYIRWSYTLSQNFKKNIKSNQHVAPFILLLNLPTEYFISIMVFSIRFFFLYLLRPCFFVKAFYIFICFKCVYICSLKHFIMVALNSLSNNSNICSFFVVSRDCPLSFKLRYLILYMRNDIHLYPGYFRYYESLDLIQIYFSSLPVKSCPLEKGVTTSFLPDLEKF